jgi:hypothetical protein
VQKKRWFFPKILFNLRKHHPAPGKILRKTLFFTLKFNPMVQVENSQLTTECNAWRASLRNYREEFNQAKTRLQQAASRSLSKDQLRDVEHLHNQFHIQLINIHDLKQAIKNHDRKIGLETNEHNGQLNEETLADHENLLGQFQDLEMTLSELKDEFSDFLKSINKEELVS